MDEIAASAFDIAVIGAGPVGLALALHAARLLPRARITLFDARAEEGDVAADPRTLALSLGSVQLLQRLHAWPAALAQPILQVHVSQTPPTLGFGGREPAVSIRANDEAVPMLGAVRAYGEVLAPLQRVWRDDAARSPQPTPRRNFQPSKIKPSRRVISLRRDRCATPLAQNPAAVRAKLLFWVNKKG